MESAIQIVSLLWLFAGYMFPACSGMIRGIENARSDEGAVTPGRPGRFLQRSLWGTFRKYALFSILLFLVSPALASGYMWVQGFPVRACALKALQVGCAMLALALLCTAAMIILAPRFKRELPLLALSIALVLTVQWLHYKYSTPWRMYAPRSLNSSGDYVIVPFHHRRGMQCLDSLPLLAVGRDEAFVPGTIYPLALYSGYQGYFSYGGNSSKSAATRPVAGNAPFRSTTTASVWCWEMKSWPFLMLFLNIAIFFVALVWVALLGKRWFRIKEQTS